MNYVPPRDTADHAEDFARRYVEPLDQYCVTRMAELGIPDDMNGEENASTKSWRALVPEERTGGYTSRGITINSGCLNPELLKGKAGTRVFAKAKLRDRIDAIIAHEFEEARLGSHQAALRRAMKTDLPISEGARRILKAMGRSVEG